jgi:hypothetical protein
MQPAVIRETAQSRPDAADRFRKLSIIQQALDRPELGGVRLGLGLRLGCGTLFLATGWGRLCRYLVCG